MMKNKNFKFFVPLELSKGKDAEGNEVMKMGGIASTIEEDSDGETLDPTGFDLSILKSQGVINWHHAQKNNPSAIIGEPTKAEITPKGLYLEAELYKDSELAKQVYKLAEVLKKNSKTRRLGFSIEGKALERDPHDKTKILKAAVTGCAITYMPKNPATICDIIKGKEVDEIYEFEDDDFQKSDLSIKSLTNSANGGDAKYLINMTTKDGSIVKVSLNGEITLDFSKAMGTSSPAGKAVTKEHVDQGEKDLTKQSEESKELSKSEVYDRIFSDIEDIELSKAKQVYNIITKISQMSKKAKPTADDIKKAYDVLGLSGGESTEEIEKGGVKTDDEEEILEKSEKVDESIEKGKKEPEEEEEETEEEEEEVEKSEDSKPLYFQKGENYVEMINQGGELKEVPNKIFKKTANGYEEVVENPIEKAIKDQLSEFTKKQDELTKALGTVIGDLKGQVSQLQNEVAEYKSATPARKSIDVKVRDKDFAGIHDKNTLEKAKADGTLVSVKNRPAMLAILDKATFKPVETGGEPDDNFAKAMETYEASGQLHESVVKRLEKEYGIIVA